MIELKIFELKNAEQALKYLSEQKLPAKGAYQVAKLLLVASKELSIIEDTRIKTIRQYGEERIQENETVLLVKEEYTEQFTKDMQQLFDSKITLLADPINITDLGNIELTPMHIISLGKLLLE